jgi:hypothetical protein
VQGAVVSCYLGFEEVGGAVLDKLTHVGNLAELTPVSGNARFKFVRGDICDAPLLRSARPGYGAVITLATDTRGDRPIGGATGFVTTNVTGVQASPRACLRTGIPKVAHMSRTNRELTTATLESCGAPRAWLPCWKTGRLTTAVTPYTARRFVRLGIALASGLRSTAGGNAKNHYWQEPLMCRTMSDNA